MKKKIPTILSATLEKKVGEKINLQKTSSAGYLGILKKDEKGFYVQVSVRYNSVGFMEKNELKVRINEDSIIRPKSMRDFRKYKEVA